MKKYGSKTQESTEEAMDGFKKGVSKSRKSDQKVTDSKQAVAVGLSKARESGAEVLNEK